MSYTSTPCSPIIFATATKSMDLHTNPPHSTSPQMGSLPWQLRPDSGKPLGNSDFALSACSCSQSHSHETIHLNHLREETEWEQCSHNPKVARLVKSRNLTERNRLTALNSQMDRQLEKKLKRMNMERRDFTVILDSLKPIRTRLHNLSTVSAKHVTVRSLTSVNSQEKTQPLNQKQYKVQPGAPMFERSLRPCQDTTHVSVVITEESTGNTKNSALKRPRPISSVSSTPSLPQLATAQKLHRLLSSSKQSRLDSNDLLDIQRKSSVDSFIQSNRPYSGDIKGHSLRNLEAMIPTDFHSTESQSSSQSSLSSFAHDKKFYHPVQFAIDD